MELLIYTNQQIEKHAALLEDHLLYVEINGMDGMCYQCVWGHLLKLEGYCEEALKFSQDSKKYLDILQIIRYIRGAVYNREKCGYVTLAQIIREVKLNVWQATVSTQIKKENYNGKEESKSKSNGF